MWMKSMRKDVEWAQACNLKKLDLDEYGVQISNTDKNNRSNFGTQQGQMDTEIIDVDDPEIIFVKHVLLVCDSDDS